MESPLLYILAYICGMMMATSVCATGDSGSELSQDSSDNNPFGKGKTKRCEERCREEFPGKAGRRLCAFACKKEKFEWYQPSKLKEAKECKNNCVTDELTDDKMARRRCKRGCLEPCFVGCGVAFTEIPHEELSLKSVKQIMRRSKVSSNISLCVRSCELTVFGRRVFKLRG